VTGTLDKLARLINEIGTSNVPTDDTPYLEASNAMRTRILDVFERALASKVVTIDELFSEDYTEIAGTNPTQYRAKFSRLCEREFPSILELTKNCLPHIAFAVATDRTGYLPVHNAEYCKPQGTDPEWNAVNCRNKRFFPTQATIAGMDFRESSYLLTRRRDLGNGKHVMLKVAFSPIWVAGRYWGAASVGYILP
jgi:methyl-accepting chemotaxis protein